MICYQCTRQTRNFLNVPPDKQKSCSDGVCFNNDRAIILVSCWLGVCVQPAAVEGFLFRVLFFVQEEDRLSKG